MEVPESVSTLVGPADDWQLVAPTNPRTGRVWLTSTHAVKQAPIDTWVALAAEARNGRWLHERFPCPEVVELVADEQYGWLVTTRLAGEPAHRPDLHGDAESLAAATGTTLARLHAIPIAGCPLPTGWSGIEAAAERAVTSGLVDPAALDDPYSRYTADALLRIWRQGRPLDEDLVVCHGDPSLPNLILRQGELVGVIDLGHMRVADRHLDLAIAQRSVHRNLGPDAAFVFYEAYERAGGARPDLVRLDHYALASLLLP